MHFQLGTARKIAIARNLARVVLFARRIVGKSPVTMSTRSGVRWLLDLEDGIDFGLFWGAYEAPTRRTLTDLCLRVPDSVVIDVGANCGAHALPIARKLQKRGTGSVFALEPSASAFRKLEKNLELNLELSDFLHPHRFFLCGSEAEKVPGEVFAVWPLFPKDRQRLHPLHCGGKQSTDGSRSLTLDRFVSEAGLGRVDVIKIDVDGYEAAILHGANETIRKHRPDLVIEWCPHVMGESHALADQIQALVNFGYRLSRVRRAGLRQIQLSDLAHLVRFKGSTNIVLTWRT